MNESHSLVTSIATRVETLSRHFEHWFTEIAPDDFCAGVGQREGNVAGAATEIERLHAWADGGKSDQAALPKAMQPEALQVVYEIVARRDFGEEIVDALGPRFVRGVK